MAFMTQDFFYPGILILKGPPHNLSRDTHDPSIVELSSVLKGQDLMGICFIVIVDDVDFTVKKIGIISFGLPLQGRTLQQISMG